jgi:hypothetical protein
MEAVLNMEREIEVKEDKILVKTETILDNRLHLNDKIDKLVLLRMNGTTRRFESMNLKDSPQ